MAGRWRDSGQENASIPQARQAHAGYVLYIRRPLAGNRLAAGLKCFHDRTGCPDKGSLAVYAFIFDKHFYRMVQSRIFQEENVGSQNTAQGGRACFLHLFLQGVDLVLRRSAASEKREISRAGSKIVRVSTCSSLSFRRYALPDPIPGDTPKPWSTLAFPEGFKGRSRGNFSWSQGCGVNIFRSGLAGNFTKAALNQRCQCGGGLFGIRP